MKGFTANERRRADNSDSSGWTPYFNLTAGPTTDVGSAVSHGTVMACDYGMPAIVNLRATTWAIKAETSSARMLTEVS